MPKITNEIRKGDFVVITKPPNKNFVGDNHAYAKLMVGQCGIVSSRISFGEDGVYYVDFKKPPKHYGYNTEHSSRGFSINREYLQVYYRKEA